jgi:hypothetical protein
MYVALAPRGAITMHHHLHRCHCTATVEAVFALWSGGQGRIGRRKEGRKEGREGEFRARGKNNVGKRGAPSGGGARPLSLSLFGSQFVSRAQVERIAIEK